MQNVIRQAASPALTFPAGPLATGEGASPPTRELAQRFSGTDEILLLWHPESDRVELSVRDRETDTGFLIEVAPGDAIEAFYHPYAYASRPESAYRPVWPTTVHGWRDAA